MPLYTFQCNGCGATRDVFTRTAATHAVIECPSRPASDDVVCQLRRIPSAPHVVIPEKHRAA